jgi:hypothetical protein
MRVLLQLLEEQFQKLGLPPEYPAVGPPQSGFSFASLHQRAKRNGAAI